MALTFYAGSGSPYVWRVWLALEHKQLPYALKMLSFSEGDTRKPEFVRLNPRHKVPVLTDEDYVIYESNAIVEYLDERFPDGPSLFPGDARQRGDIRRLIREIDEYLGAASHPLVRQIFFLPREQWNLKQAHDEARACKQELAYFEQVLSGDYLAGELSAADFTLYPRVATLLRIEKRCPELVFGRDLPTRVAAWMRRIEALPYFGKTYPPHWR